MRQGPPPIPAETRRQVLTEVGHRCAVCGAKQPLLAHIVPWSQSRDNSAANLIGLCATCQMRADAQNWGEETLRQYKQRPWVRSRGRIAEVVGRSEDESGSAGFDLSGSTGLFVGISNFEDGRIHEVPFAVDDAVDLAHLFTLELGLLSPERTVLLLAGEPRKPESTERLERLVERGAHRQTARMRDIYRYLGELARSTEERGIFVLSMAAHGVSDQGGDFLVATDSLRERILLTGVSVTAVFDDVARAGAGCRLVLLDACRERLSNETRDLRGAPESAMTQSFADAIARAKGSVVLSGATLGGYAYDDGMRQNGVFTAAILDGLRGEAPAGPEGWITVRTLADFVQQRVAEWVRRNRPDDAAKSLGIGRRIEANAETLPLTPHPNAMRERQRYQTRRKVALARVRENLGRVLSGTHWDQVATLLEGPLSPEIERLLDEIEALDGGERSQRSLRDFLRECSNEEDPSPLPMAEKKAARRAEDRQWSNAPVQWGKPKAEWWKGIVAALTKRVSKRIQAGIALLALLLLGIIVFLVVDQFVESRHQGSSSLEGAGGMTQKKIQSSVPAAEPLVVGSWNFANLGIDNGNTRDPLDLSELIMASAVDVLALVEIYDTDGKPGIRKNSVLDEVFQHLNQSSGHNWRYTLFPKRDSKDRTQLTGIAWNDDRVDLVGQPFRIPTVDLEPELDLWNRHPHAVKFSSGVGRTDFVVIPLHMSSNGRDASVGRIQRQMEALSLVGQLYRVKDHFSDNDIVLIGDTNCLEAGETALAVFQKFGFRDLNAVDHPTFIDGDSPFDRILVPGDQSEFRSSEQTILVTGVPEWHRRVLSDHYLVRTDFQQEADDD